MNFIDVLNKRRPVRKYIPVAESVPPSKHHESAALSLKEARVA
jgi:hypothetical protein